MGIFFMAFTLVLVGFSCTGPIAGTILLQAASGEAIMPIVGMLGFSMAFAIPLASVVTFEGLTVPPIVPYILNPAKLLSEKRISLPDSGTPSQSLSSIVNEVLSPAFNVFFNGDIFFHSIRIVQFYLQGWIIVLQPAGLFEWYFVKRKKL